MNWTTTSTSCLDLAATCAEFIGSTGSLAVKLNHMLRVYRDVPPDLRGLQAQVASGKQDLERLLVLLDRDQPAFQHANDIEAIDLHFRAIGSVVGDVQKHVTQLEQARSSPFPHWASVRQIWTVEVIDQSKTRLDRQLKGLEVYLKVSRPDTEAEQLVQIVDFKDKACLIAAWDDALTYISPPETNDQNSFPTISVEEPSSLQSGTSYSVHPDAENAKPAQNSPSAGYTLPTDHGDRSSPSSPISSTPSQVNLPSAESQVFPNEARRSSYWRDAFKNQGMYIPSARKLKSMALLQKPAQGTPSQPGIVDQSDEINLAKFKTRVSGYACGVSPIWELRTVPAKKKQSKQRYHNRFTRNSGDELSPEKLQSHFKVTEKPVWDAILNRKLEKVTSIMEHRWSDNLVVEKRDRLTALHLAASLGLCSIVQMLVSLGANPNHTDRYGATAVHHAADFGCANCLNILMGAKGRVDLEYPKTHVKTALFYAARAGNLEAALTLLNLGAHVYTNHTTPQETVLYAAVESGSVQLCEAIINKGGHPGESFATLSLAAETSRGVLALLVNAGADINVHDSEQETLLHKYVCAGDAEMVAILLALGANPKAAADGSGRMPLHIALDRGGPQAAPAIAEALLAAGDDPNCQNALGQTPLHLAVLWGRAEVAQVLCRFGADLRAVGPNGVIPYMETQELGYASRAGNNAWADFPGTKAALERWEQESIPRVAEVHGEAKAVPEIEGRRLMGKPGVELGNILKPIRALNLSKSPVEMSDSRRSVHEMDAPRLSITRKPVLAELPGS